MANIFHIDRSTGVITLAQESTSTLLSLNGSNQLQSTNNLASFSPIFGGLTVDTDTLVVDSVNHRVGIGTASPSYVLEVNKAVDGESRIEFNNTSTNAAAWSQLSLKSDDGRAYLAAFGSSYTTLPYLADKCVLYNSSANDGIIILTANSGSEIQFNVGGFTSGETRLSITSSALTCSVASTFGDGGSTNYLGISAAGNLSFSGSASFLPPRISQSAQPTPNSGSLLIWRDTDDDKTHIVYNDPDVGVRKVEMT